MPTVITADWTYLVSDHRQQGAPLVPVPAPAGTTPAAAATAAADEARAIDPFGSDGGDDDDSDHPVGDVTGIAVPACRGRGSGGGGGRKAEAIAAGWRHSVAISEEGAVFAWGCGAGGELGLGPHADVDIHRQVTRELLPSIVDRARVAVFLARYG